jgi:hypothetical protein
MTEETFFDRIDPILSGLGASDLDGESFRAPPLDVLRYDRRPVLVSWIPWFGRGLSVTTTARQPVDLGSAAGDLQKLLARLAMAVNGRFPPWTNGPILAFTAVVLTSEPIAPGDDEALRRVVDGRPFPRQRAVPLGLIRVNLGQEAMSFAIASGPSGVFPEPAALVDGLTPVLRRFVPLIDGL